jgi:hypothetical protein
VDHFEAHGEALDLEALLPVAERDWINGLHHALPPTFELPVGAAGAFTEGTFYPAFLKDLARVRESIVILSPFATGSGTGRWVDPLREALGRGVRVRIVTRPPEESGGGSTDEVIDLVRGLRGLGVTVDLRARMHEKIAILDDRVLWHGSLNILSHRDTHESMLRIESPAACQQLGRFLSTPTRRREEMGAKPRLDAPENPSCPVCGGPTVWNDGRHGIHFRCGDTACDGKVDARRGRGQAGNRRGQQSPGRRGQHAGTSTSRMCQVPGCDGRLVEREGRFGRFLGCTNYPSCRYTESLE